jgi:hypothetical protein
MKNRWRSYFRWHRRVCPICHETYALRRSHAGLRKHKDYSTWPVTVCKGSGPPLMRGGRSIVETL